MYSRQTRSAFLISDIVKLESRPNRGSPLTPLVSDQSYILEGKEAPSISLEPECTIQSVKTHEDSLWVSSVKTEVTPPKEVINNV